MAQLDAYLFDLDGTLIDSLELILRSYRHTLTVHRGTAPPNRLWLAGLGTPLRTQLAAFADDTEELDRMVATYRDHNFAHHDELVRPFPGTRVAVSTAKAKGIRLALVTSKARGAVDRGLRVCGLDDLFGTIVAADDVAEHKPHPAPVLKALELLDTEADRAVFFGDSPFDMAAGKAAGVRTAGVLWGPFSRSDLGGYDPDFWITRPSQIGTLALR